MYRFAQIVAAATLALEISASAAMATAGSENFFRAHHERGGLRLPGLEVGTVGGGTLFPYARTWLEVMDCAGTGKVYRFAQIIAAATLALEISASASMATAGSENFFQAHHQLGGKRH